MQSLVRFIVKYYYFFLFLLFQLVALSIFFTHNSFHRSNFLNATDAMAGAVYARKTAVSEYLNLSDKNRILAEQNAFLLNQAKDAFIDLRANRKHIADSATMQQYSYVAAKVVNSTVKRRNNFITINKGKRHGIEPDMGVICSQGVVGFVQSVSSNYAIVIPILNNKFTASVRLSKSNFFGLLKWGGTNPERANLKDIPKHASVEIGDTIVTRGSSSYFPEGVLVGKINSIAPESSANYHDLEVSLSTDFYNLDYVYVIENILKIEQQELEEAAEE